MGKAFVPKPMENHAHTQHVVMVCVTRQRTCARLIEQGEAAARERACPLHVVHAVRTGENFLGNPDEGEALEYLFTAAQLSGGELAVLRADDVAVALAEYAGAHNVSCIVMGAPPRAGGHASVTVGGMSILEYLRQRLPQVELRVVRGEE